MESIKKIKSIQRNFSRYALWKSGATYQEYSSRLTTLNMITLEKRRKLYTALTAADIITARIDSPYLLSIMNFKVNRFSGSLRSTNTLNLNSARNNYSLYEPINNLCRTFNYYCDAFDYNQTKTQFKNAIFSIP